MSGKEIKRLEVLRRLADGVLSQREAGRVLGVSERQVRRLARRYLEPGHPDRQPQHSPGSAGGQLGRLQGSSWYRRTPPTSAAMPNARRPVCG